MEDLASLPDMDGPYDTSADAFYEEIEAPKFVDLTDKDPFRVDDRYWFCSRVGCDQKHEEELDSEEVYKNFVLRVMAARSPNVRLQKALSRRCGPATKAKCPQSAPPKSTRPTVSRLAIVSSSMAPRIASLKSKSTEQLTKASTTPTAKVKVVGAKYMTTPRNKNPETKHDTFHSVQNPKKGGCVGELKSRVAKALVFHSPKKTVKLKASLELKTPVRKICEKLKKLELDDEESRKKRVLGYSPKTTSSTLKPPKANIIRPWRVDGSSKVKKVGLAENEKPKSKEMSQHCDKLSVSPDETQDSENHVQVAKQEVLQDADAKAVEEQQSSMVLNENVLTETDDDDKENVPGAESKPEDARGTGRKVHALEKTSSKFLKNLMQIKRPVPNQKEVGKAANAQVLKYSKPKPTNPKPFRLRTDERGILKEAHLEKRVNSAGKCHGENVSETRNKPGIIKLKSNGVKEVQDKASSRTLKKPSIVSAAPLEQSKVITAAKTPEKPKSILVSSTKRKTVTPNRENIARKRTVSFILPGEKTPEVLSATENPRKALIKKSPAMAKKSPITKNSSSSSAWRLP